MRLRFSKMHGAGNDFVLIDQRALPRALSNDEVQRICDRHIGVGCDQLMLIASPRTEGAALAYLIRNQDGSQAAQCGNGARCVAGWARRAGLLGDQGGLLDSPVGPITVRFVDDEIELSMGQIQFNREAVGFCSDQEATEIAFAGRWWTFYLASMGNPHALIEIDEIDTAPVADLGAAMQADSRFADSCNVGFVEVVSHDHIRLRVFERGVGETLACGSGACAAVGLMQREGRCRSPVRVDLPGGTLQIDCDQQGQMRMRGPIQFVFEGEMEL